MVLQSQASLHSATGVHVAQPTAVVDFFFSAYAPPSQQRMQAALADGLAHGSQIAPRDPAPAEPVTLTFVSRAALPIDNVAVYYTVDGSEPQGERGVASNGAVVYATPSALPPATGADLPARELRQWQTTLPGQPEGTLVRYRADAWSTSVPALHWYADNSDPVSLPPTHGNVFAYSVDRFHAPPWFADAIIYQIFVDRFRAAQSERPMRAPDSITGFYGGTLRGVAESLDYIAALGATCLWLSPIFESPTHHGYNPSSYHDVAKRYGGDAALRETITAAHAHGMRVVLDFVANHTSDEHPQFRAARRDPHSHAADLYSIGDWPPNGYRAYALVPTMPELNTEHPATQRYLIDAALYWLETLGTDGLRLDYMPGPSYAFWAQFQRAIKQRMPQALTLGEITETSAGLATYAGRVDAVMDFPTAGLLRRIFAQRTQPLADLLAAQSEQQRCHGDDLGRATLLDNHDMHRFLWIAGGDTQRLRVASACQMTLPGTPIIYYGTEVGLSQYGDAHRENAYARAPMFWQEGFQDRRLLQHYRRLCALRQAHPALRRGAFAAVPLAFDMDGSADAQQVGAYLRWLGDDRLLVVVNNTTRQTTVRIALGTAWALMDGGAETHASAPQLLLATEESGRSAYESDDLTLTLAPLSAMVFGLGAEPSVAPGT